MSRLVLNITESLETLLELLSQETNESRVKRLKMLKLLKNYEANTFQEIAEILQVDYWKIIRWCKIYREGGLETLMGLRVQEPLRDINILEPPELLLDLISQQQDRWKYKKLQLLYIVKTEPSKSLKEIAKLLEISDSIPSAWLRKYRQSGLEALLGKGKPSLSEIPDWAIERLLEELQDAQFLPKEKAVKVWLTTVLGTKISRDIASEVLASRIKPKWKPAKYENDNKNFLETLEDNSSKQLSINQEINSVYEQWKANRGFTNESQALNQLINEFFELNNIDVLSKLAVSDEVKNLANTVSKKVPGLLNQTELAKRLGVTNQVLSRNRKNRTFSEWTKKHDPDGIGWEWVASIRKYKPLISEKDI